MGESGTRSCRTRGTSRFSLPPSPSPPSVVVVVVAVAENGRSEEALLLSVCCVWFGV